MSTLRLRSSHTGRPQGRPTVRWTHREFRNWSTTSGQTRTFRAVVNRYSGGSGGVLDRTSDLSSQNPGGFNTDKDSSILTLPRPETGGGDGNTDRLRGSPPGGGAYRVLLLKDPQHREAQVVKAITTVVQGTDESHARNCFSTSQELGMAIVTTCLKEIAEFYQFQLYRYGCRTAIEPDTSAV